MQRTLLTVPFLLCCFACDNPQGLLDLKSPLSIVIEPILGVPRQNTKRLSKSTLRRCGSTRGLQKRIAVEPAHCCFTTTKTTGRSPISTRQSGLIRDLLTLTMAEELLGARNANMTERSPISTKPSGSSRSSPKHSVTGDVRDSKGDSDKAIADFSEMLRLSKPAEGSGDCLLWPRPRLGQEGRPRQGHRRL